MSSSARPYLLFLTAGAAVVVAAIAVWVSTSGVPEPVSSTPMGGDVPNVRGDAVASARLPSATVGECRFAPGQRLAYRVRSISAGRVSTTSILQGDTQHKGDGPDSNLKWFGETQDFSVEHVWYLDANVVTAPADEDAILVAAVRSEGLRGRLPQGMPAQLGDLSAPFLIRLGADCALTGLARLEDSEARSASTQQMLVRSLQWRIPRGGATPNVERDTFGRYEAEYYDDREGDGGHVVRRRISRYVEVTSVGLNARAGVQNKVSLKPGGPGLRVRLGRGPWFDSLSDDRTVELAMGPKIIGRVSSKVEAQRSEPGATFPDLDPADPSWIWGDFILNEMVQTDAPNADPSLRSVTLDSVIDRFWELLAGTRDDEEASRMLGAWIRANPEQIAALLELLVEGRFDGRVNALMRALWAAKTPEAAKALFGIMTERRFDSGKRTMAMRALAQSDLMRDELLGELTRLAWRASEADPDGIDKTDARLMLGAFLREPGDADPAAVTAALEALRGQLDSATPDQGDLSSAITAAGNSGVDSLYEPLSAHFGSEDVGIRATAARAATQMSPAVTEDAFARWLTSGDSPEVIDTIARGIPSQYGSAGTPIPPKIVKGLVAAFQVPTTPLAREALLSAIGAAAGGGSIEAKQAIEDAMAAELSKPSGSRDVRFLQALGSHVDQATMRRLSAP